MLTLVLTIWLNRKLVVKSLSCHIYREYKGPVFVHFIILGKFERGIHGEALPSHVYLSKTSLIY